MIGIKGLRGHEVPPGYTRPDCNMPPPPATLQRDADGRPYVLTPEGERIYLDRITEGTGNVGIGFQTGKDVTAPAEPSAVKGLPP